MILVKVMNNNNNNNNKIEEEKKTISAMKLKVVPNFYWFNFW